MRLRECSSLLVEWLEGDICPRRKNLHPRLALRTPLTTNVGRGANILRFLYVAVIQALRTLRKIRAHWAFVALPAGEKL